MMIHSNSYQMAIPAARPVKQGPLQPKLSFPALDGSPPGT